MLFYIKTNAIVWCFLFSNAISFSQSADSLSFFSPSPDFNKQRLTLAATAAGLSYTGLSIALYQTWYKDFDQEGFHFFNDWNEWRNVDKAGHVYSAHAQALMSYKAAKWTGMEESQAIWSGVLIGALAQTTIEVMDGYSSKWGFSLSDFGANALGLALFAGQQSVWREQRIVLKVSSSSKDYTQVRLEPFNIDGINQPIKDFENTIINEQVRRLYGSSGLERFLKDYNAQTIWMSANVNAFFPQAPTPDWLNLSFGYGAENLLGGFDNQWTANGNIYNVDLGLHPRHSQYFLSPDIDLTRIKVKKPFWKTVLSVLNILKIPMPTLEYNSTGQFVWHWLFL